MSGHVQPDRGAFNVCGYEIEDRRVHGLFRLFELPRDGEHQRAFHTLSEQIAAIGVDTVDASRGVVCVCGTAAGAVEPRPAGAAFLARVDVAGGKLILHGMVRYAVKDIAEFERLFTHELVAGIEIAPRRHRHVLHIFSPFSPNLQSATPCFISSKDKTPSLFLSKDLNISTNSLVSFDVK